MKSLLSDLTKKLKEYKKLYDELNKALDYGENKAESFESFSEYKDSLKEYA